MSPDSNRNLVAVFDDVRLQIQTDDVDLPTVNSVEQVMQREGQVTLSAPEIDDANWT
jgi:hypothetical protein